MYNYIYSLMNSIYMDRYEKEYFLGMQEAAKTLNISLSTSMPTDRFGNISTLYNGR